MKNDHSTNNFSKAELEAMRRAARDESGVMREFWEKIRSVARKVPFAENIVAAAYCAADEETPARVKLLIVGAIAYFVMPLDALPDFLPMIGFTDDAAVIAATLATVRAHLRSHHYEKARVFLGLRQPDV